MSVVLVDWLGRGGIAQCTEAWAMTLQTAGVEALVVTRPGRELGSGPVAALTARDSGNRVALHAGLAREAARVVLEHRPAVVVVQNYLIPMLEDRVYRTARRAGAVVVVVVHDHHLHSRWAGTAIGLRRLLTQADIIVAHSHFVGDALAAQIGRAVEVVPHPLQTGLLAAPPLPLPFEWHGSSLLALHFGVVHRRYKGTATIVSLAHSAPRGWEVAVMGAGAPADVLGTSRFVEPGELVTAVRSAAAVLLPYRWATQSGAVVLTQALGSVAVATSVGGIPEQIEDGVTGRLLPLQAPVSAWRDVLEELSNGEHRADLVEAGQRKVSEEQRWFEAAVRRLVGADP